jgi:hypothetical protein
MFKSYRYRESPPCLDAQKDGLSQRLARKPRVHKPHDIVAHSALDDHAHVAQTAALVIGNNNVALCSSVCLLQAYRLLGVGAEILWNPGLGASYGML